MTGRELVAFELAAWRRHPPLLSALLVAGAAGALALGAPDLAPFLGAALVALAGPFTLFWRDDAAILARLPVTGTALYTLGTAGSARFAVPILAGLAGGLLARGASLVGLGIVAAGMVMALLVGPPAAALAGAILASDRAQQAVKSVSAGYSPPPVVVLSFLPALAAAGVGVIMVIAAAEPYWLALGLAGALALFVAGRGLAARTLGPALRAVTALGAVRLAHVDLVSARGLERVFGALAGAGRAIYLKDVALTHRRWPLFGLGSAVCIACLWGSAFAKNQVGWATAGVLGILVLAALLALTLVRPPTEPPRILPVLPIPHSAATRAKAVLVLWRIVWPLALGSLGYVARALF